MDKEGSDEINQNDPKKPVGQDKTKPKKSKVIWVILLVIFIWIFISYLPFVSGLIFFRPNSQDDTVLNNIDKRNKTATSTVTQPASKEPAKIYPKPQDCQQVNITTTPLLEVNTAEPGFKKKESTVYYQIYGGTAADLRHQMNACGPKTDGKSYDGQTNYSVNWKYDFKQLTNGCGVKNVTVAINIIFYYPKWNKPGDYQEGLEQKWNNFMELLTLHENGHRDFDIEAGQKILEAISALPPATDCQKMADLANSKGHEVLNYYKAKNTEYDETTNHGATQGVRFP